MFIMRIQLTNLINKLIKFGENGFIMNCNANKKKLHATWSSSCNLIFLLFIDEISWEIGNLLSLEIFITIISITIVSLGHNMCYSFLKLEMLFIHNNKFAGHIPPNIGDCSNLQILSLYSNQLSGIIPRSIGNLTKLKEIYLSNNYLEGKLIIIFLLLLFLK